MENDIIFAPAGYMTLYILALAVFGWNFYRILRQRSARVRIEDQDHQYTKADAQTRRRDS